MVTASRHRLLALQDPGEDSTWTVRREAFRLAVHKPDLQRGNRVAPPDSHGQRERDCGALAQGYVVASQHSVQSRRHRDWVGALLGLRWAEVAGLTVGSLDLLQHALTVVEQLGRDRQLGDPKSGVGKRQLSMPAELSAVLAAHLAARNLTGADPGQLLFTTPQGRPLDYSHWRIRTWLPAVANAGLTGAGFHDLRRADATTLVAAGVDVKTAQTRLGHADPRTTLSIYARAVPKADRAAADALGRTFFQTPAERSRAKRAREADTR